MKELSLQRAGLLAILTGIMRADNDVPLLKVKTAIAGTFSNILLENSIGDDIETQTVESMMVFLESEIALSEIKDQLDGQAK